MDHNIEIKLIEEAKQNVAQKTTSLGNAEQRSSISRYLDENHFNVEIEKVFKRLPSILLHSSSIEENNAYKAVSSPLGNLLVSRDDKGVAHVFYNSCRHRGAKLADGKACQKHIVCPYHAWAYSTDGSLVSVPGQAQCFPSLEKKDNGLIEIASVEKYGFIWVCPQAGNAQSAESMLTDHLADMGSHLSWAATDKCKVFEKTTKVWNGNWKLFAEGGLETYHFAFAHRQTIAPSFFNNIAVIDQLGQHFRVVMPTRELTKNESESLHDCSHTLFFLLPNTALLVQKEHIDWIQFRPLAFNQTEITVTTLIPSSANLTDAKQLNHWIKNHKITNVTLDEDWQLGEDIQSSLASGGLPYIQYGKNEWALGQLNQILSGLIFQE